jgi:hypothetical protein
VLYSHNLKKKIFFILFRFHFHKFFSININYKIHDKEFLAIVDVFEECCHLLEGVQHEIIMHSYHKNLQYFITTRVLNQCQTQWALSLSQFWFCHHTSPWAPTRKTWCIVPLLVPCPYGRKCNLWTTMWCHSQTWTSSTLSIVDNS